MNIWEQLLNINFGYWIMIAIIIWIIFIYNSLIKKKIRTEEAWFDIDVQLKRRYDLIPNLVETVKSYAKYEDETFLKIIDARNKAMILEKENIAEKDLSKLSETQNRLNRGINKLFALAENYPDLKSNTSFLQLQDELVDTEDKIQAARRFYNMTVQDYNESRAIFPNLFISKIFAFQKKDFFHISSINERAVVNVDFE